LAGLMSRKNRAALSARPANLACPADISFAGFSPWAASDPVPQAKPGPGPALRQSFWPLRERRTLRKIGRRAASSGRTKPPGRNSLLQHCPLAPWK
jgi:hypothetical protein